MRNILLARAVIAARIDPRGKVIAVKVFDKADPAITRADTPWDLTWGACLSCWDEQPGARLDMFREILLHLIRGHDASPQAVHDAAMAVHEYRDWHLSEA